MSVHRLVVYFVILLFFIFVSLPVAHAVSFTFSGTIDGLPKQFTVSSVGYNKPPYPIYTSYGSTLWSWDWQINSISSWAVLDYPVGLGHTNNGPSFGQLLYGAPYDGHTDWGFEYYEDLGGNNTSKSWEQIINISASKPFNKIGDLLNDDTAFLYHEATAYTTNYTPDDGGATANWMIIRVNAYVTLVAFDLSDIAPAPAPTPSPVPEPSTMLVLGSGLFSLWQFRKKFRN